MNLKVLYLTAFFALSGVVLTQVAAREGMFGPRSNVAMNFTDAKGDVFEMRPDGSKFIKAPDGSTILIQANGTKVITEPDGTSLVVRPDGSKFVKKPDGTTVNVPAGR